MEQNKNLKITEKCPRFSFCNAPRCPLEEEVDLQPKFKEDEKCGLSKNRRVKIAEDSDLPYKGMTKSEWVATKRFQNLSPEDKEKLIKNGCVALKNLKIS